MTVEGGQPVADGLDETADPLAQYQSHSPPMPEIWRLLIVHRTVLTYPDTVTTS